MNCILMWLSTCIIDPSNIYLTAGLYDNDIHKAEGSWCSNKERGWFCRGPMAELKLGTVIDVTQTISLDVGVMHRSFPMEKEDYGSTGPYISMTYRPWRK